MRASIGAMLIGLLGAGAVLAQPQGVFLPVLPPRPPLPNTLPPLPAGAAYAAAGVPAPGMPNLPTAPLSPAMSAPWTPLAAPPIPALPGPAFAQPPAGNSAPLYAEAPLPAPMAVQASPSPNGPLYAQMPLPLPTPVVPGQPVAPGGVAPSVATPLSPNFEATASQPDDPAVPQIPAPSPSVDPAWQGPVSYGGRLGLFNGVSCGRSFWVNADYLRWWIQRGPETAPLLVTGPASDPFPGALDQPHTTVLYGGQGLSYNPFSGLRVSAGMWSRDQRFGFEMSGFMLQQGTTSANFAGDASGNPFLAIPFVNARTGNENVYFVSQNFADPTKTAMMTGSVGFSSSSQLWGYEANGLLSVFRGSFVNASLIAGYRSLRLKEQMQINENLRNLPGGGGLTFAGSTVDALDSVSTYDSFGTQNTFYGGQLGARFHFEHNRFSLDLTGKAAVGVSQEVLNIAGGSALQDAAGRTIADLPGGVFAQATNIGHYTQNKFAVVPEGNANLSYAVTNWLVLRAGYTFIYWSSVLRPGNQIDRSIDPGAVPTDLAYGTGNPTHPAAPLQTSSVWLQGVNFGLEFRY